MKYLLAIIFIVMCVPQVSAHECHIKSRQEMSMHFQDVSLMKALHVIAGFADKDLLIKTKRDITIPLHYNCKNWKSIIRDLDKKYDFKIYIYGTSIVIKEQY